MDNFKLVCGIIKEKQGRRIYIFMKTIDWIAKLLLVIGGINWGLTAVGFNLVDAIFGDGAISMIVYILVGISGLWGIKMLIPEKSSAPAMSQ